MSMMHNCERFSKLSAGTADKKETNQHILVIKEREKKKNR